MPEFTRPDLKLNTRLNTIEAQRFPPHVLGLNEYLRLSPRFDAALSLTDNRPEQASTSKSNLIPPTFNKPPIFNKTSASNKSLAPNKPPIQQPATSRLAFVSGDLSRHLLGGASESHARAVAHLSKLEGGKAGNARPNPWTYEDNKQYLKCVCSRCASKRSKNKDGAIPSKNTAKLLEESFLAVREVARTGVNAANTALAHQKPASGVEAWAQALPSTFDPKPMQFEAEFKAIAEGRIRVVSLKYTPLSQC